MKLRSVMNNTILMMILLIVCRFPADSQAVYGSVKDAETGQPIGFCSITFVKSGSGTTADAGGKFKIVIPSQPLTPELIFTYVGYYPDTVLLSSGIQEYKIRLQPTQGTLSEVVVTGVSKATLIKENPVPVISVSAKAIESSTEDNIIDVLVKNVPGLNAVKTGPNISKPFIRGLGYNRVLTLYDGIRQEGQQWGDEHGLEADAYNIDKAEIIKGPASLMYGSDAVAGVVSILSAMPVRQDKKLHGKYFSEYQHNNGLVGNGIRLTWADDHWAYVMRGSWRVAKNYANSIDGRVYNTGFRETNASSTIQYKSNKGNSNLNVTLYDNLQGIPDGSRDSITRKFTQQIYEGNKDDIKNRPLVPDAALNSYSLSPLHQHIQHYRVYSNNHYEIGQGDIDFSIAFQQNIRREYNHPTLPQQAGMYVRLNTWNYGFRYNAPAICNIEITLGINGMYQNNKNKKATDFPIPDYNLFDAGTYLFAKWKQNKWTISGGARYDIRYLQGNDFYTVTDALLNFRRKVSPPDTAGAYLQFSSFSKTFTGTSLSFGITYKINEYLSLKVNIANGYRAPNITEFASNGLDPGAHIIYLGNRNFVPEFSLQEDIGADIRFKNISASLSIFNNDLRHYIYLSQVTDANGNLLLNSQGNKTYQYQQSAARLYGLEAILNLHPAFIKGFSFNNSFSLIYGYNKKQEFKNKGINGEYLPLIPPLKLVSSINYEIKVKSKLFSAFNYKAEAGFTGAQDRYLALDNNETATPAYVLFNFAISTQINLNKSNTLQFQLQVNNVFDKSYQSNLSRLKYFEYYTQSLDGHSGIYNMGRTICAKLIVPF
ncbi:MAG: putative tonB-linked outer rane receptor [Chitinophagaceae bacterium]|nr:putative tonB-linked outer rane receptor [Chitinophagaceae bacterium]